MNNTDVQKQREFLVDVDTRKLFAWNLSLAAFSVVCIIAATIIDVTTTLSGVSLVLASVLLLLGEFIILPSITLIGYAIILQCKNKTKTMGKLPTNIKSVTVFAVSIVASSILLYITQFMLLSFARAEIYSNKISSVLFEIFRYYCEIAVFVGITLLVLSWILRIIKDKRDLKYRKTESKKHA